jgi:lysophospholipid acyltransferase (LPLAT)-like uncharacterized protein
MFAIRYKARRWLVLWTEIRLEFSTWRDAEYHATLLEQMGAKNIRIYSSQPYPGFVKVADVQSKA